MKTKNLILLILAITGFIFAGVPAIGQNKSMADTAQQGAVVYTCTMHPEVQSHQPGACPKCGMQLVKKTEAPKMQPKKHQMKMMCPMMGDMENMDMDNQAAKTKMPNDSILTGGVVYTCSMHPEITSSQPGYCPKCGMALINKSAVPEKKARRHKMPMMGMGIGMGILMAGMLLFFMRR